MEGTFEAKDRTVKKNEKKRKAEDDLDDDAPATKRLEIAPGQSVPGPGANVPQQENLPPNHILFVQNLPDGMQDSHLSVLFQRYSGFKDVKLISARNVAFVEFDNEMNASAAMMAFQNFRFSPERPMVINYAKK
jgi:RNA recognition motif-containing protein